MPKAVAKEEMIKRFIDFINKDVDPDSLVSMLDNVTWELTMYKMNDDNFCGGKTDSTWSIYWLKEFRRVFMD